MKLELIHEDNRGSINIIKGDELTYPEITVFKTKQGYARGGCIHRKSEEYATVIEGRITYVTPKGYFHLYAGDNFIIPKGTPHYFLSNTDSIVLEWGATEEEKKEKHLHYREIVDEINSRQLASDML